MKFTVVGPFKLKRINRTIWKKEAKEDLLKKLDKWGDGLPDAHGCTEALILKRTLRVILS